MFDALNQSETLNEQIEGNQDEKVENCQIKQDEIKNKNKNKEKAKEFEDPLLRLSRLTQEDWIILKWDEGKEEYILTAGLVCALMRWRLTEKFQQSVISLIHEPVKTFTNHFSKKVFSILNNLKPHITLCRDNWVIVNDLEGTLDLYTPESTYDEPPLTIFEGDTTGKSLVYRSEYQTLRKLPKSNCIAFSLRTYQYLQNNLKLSPTKHAKNSSKL